MRSIFLSAKHVVPVFRKQGGGAFVNIASTAGVRPRPGLTVYNSSKGAVITMSRSMAGELGPDKIRVNVVNPVFSPFTGLSADFVGGKLTPEVEAKFVATIPLGRPSTPLDIANAVLYLASDEAAFISGVCLEVDGARCVYARLAHEAAEQRGDLTFALLRRGRLAPGAGDGGGAGARFVRAA